ncbi:NAS6 [Candida theae]|uniref:NAS6 n=1 Tax=Candida theae TaxID=1198502 RepID=A0AAD5BAF2_9ASCO|nr:NAS6 [Candida theae]KAI5948683.1 NAS6 [Candida theae]
MSSDKFPIHTAIKEGNFNLAKQLISQQSPNKSTLVKDDDDRTPLHWAVSIDNAELVQFIVEHLPKGTDIDELVDGSGWTPLHINSSIGNIEILNILIHTDPQPDINLPTNQGTTALHLTVSKNHVRYASVLIDEMGANCRVKDKKGYTPLHRASSIGSIGILKLLINSPKGVNVNAKDNDGWTSLHHALAEGHGDAAVFLVNEGGADINAENNEGQTPIQVAVDEKVAKYFKEHTSI